MLLTYIRTCVQREIQQEEEECKLESKQKKELHLNAV